MPKNTHWVTDENIALLTDLYQFTMTQAYYKLSMTDKAVFSLFFQKLPQGRNYMLACGLDDILDQIGMHFSRDSLKYLEELKYFSDDFLSMLANFRFTGDVYAIPEGTPVFAQEPLLEIVAPMIEAQLMETLIINQIHVQTVLCSKGARIKLAAGDKKVIDFTLRRTHGADAGLKGARAFYIAGIDATSNVLAGKVYNIPLAGTMAHSCIQARNNEEEILRQFAKIYPHSTLLVDTYDTIKGVKKVLKLAKTLGDEFQVDAIRIDSGNFVELAIRARELLDNGGMPHVRIFVSSGLDEFQIAEIVRQKAPVDVFGVGTSMGVSEDAPDLSLVYKLTTYGNKGRVKTSTGKHTLPGPKQVFRKVKQGVMYGDTIARSSESLPGRPLLEQVMQGGQRLSSGNKSLAEIRTYAQSQIASLPACIRALEPTKRAYPVKISARLKKYFHEVVMETQKRDIKRKKTHSTYCEQ